MSFTRPSVTPAAVAGLVLLVGCAETATLPTTMERPPALAASTAMAVVEQAPGEGGTVRWTVRVLTRDLAVGAYQGEVTFPAGAYEVVSVTTPEEEGAMRVVNAGEAGRLRFAAYALEGFGSDVVLTAVVRERQTGAAGEVRAVLEVAGAPTGEPVAASQLVASKGLYR